MSYGRLWSGGAKRRLRVKNAIKRVAGGGNNMTDPRLWVPVSVAADILKVGDSTIKRQVATKELLCRKIGRSIQVSRVSICQACLKESFPDATDYPLNCDICQYFKPSILKNQQKSSPN